MSKRMDEDEDEQDPHWWVFLHRLRREAGALLEQKLEEESEMPQRSARQQTRTKGWTSKSRIMIMTGAHEARRK